MKADTIKLIFTYIVVLTLLIGGGAMVYSIRLDPPESGSGNLTLAIIGLIGAAVQWTFSTESATRATRAAEASFAASAAAQPTTTVTAGPPARATITPAAPIDEEHLPPPM